MRIRKDGATGKTSLSFSFSVCSSPYRFGSTIRSLLSLRCGEGVGNSVWRTRTRGEVLVAVSAVVSYKAQGSGAPLSIKPEQAPEQRMVANCTEGGRG